MRNVWVYTISVKFEIVAQYEANLQDVFWTAFYYHLALSTNTDFLDTSSLLPLRSHVEIFAEWWDPYTHLM